jgi:pyruvate/2-oxoglutarate dehydrogenase complex dihydrolipoamide dehydrogenase (E3) component
MARVGRARERSETQGFMKALVDGATRKILGASMLGINCDEVIQLLLVVMYSGQPHTLINRSMLIHPTVAELVPTLFERLKPVEQRVPGPSHMGG